jgi:predicted RNA polymerase sigma factor
MVPARRQLTDLPHVPPSKASSGGYPSPEPVPGAHAAPPKRAGDASGAARAYERAIALSSNAVERAELERRLSALR